jgi:hypothetical protein
MVINTLHLQAVSPLLCKLYVIRNVNLLILTQARMESKGVMGYLLDEVPNNSCKMEESNYQNVQSFYSLA